MQQFQEYLRKRLAERVKQRRVVVWYDSRGDFIPFVEDLGVPPPGEPTALPALCPVVLDGTSVDFVRYDGSYFALRAAVEPLVQGDTPACLVVYLPGVERDPKGSVLMELELGGDLYQPMLLPGASHASAAGSTRRLRGSPRLMTPGASGRPAGAEPAGPMTCSAS